MEIPIMPLHAVLFPGMPLPLFIFEQRYVKMLADRQDEEDAFGIALIREGQEVGGPAVPFEIGTTAAVVRALELAEGGLHVLAVGHNRFRLRSILQTHPVLVGDVELLEEDDGKAPAELADELRELLGAHLRLVLQLLGQPETEIKIPDSVSRLSFMAAAHLTCPPLSRQRLLEMDELAGRLFHLRQMLQRESDDYRLLLAARRKYDEVVGQTSDSVFSLN